MEFRVLVIDDEEILRMSICDILEEDGYELHEAGNGQEGLDKYHEIQPHLIISDLRMPVMDGVEMIQKINLKPTDLCSIIVLTGHGDDEDIKKCYQAGISTFLGKPFNVYQLQGLARHAFNLFKAKSELLNLTQELKDFVHVASHDLQDPLRKVISNTDRLLKRYDKELPADAKNLISKTQNSASRMKGLILNLLQYSRVTNRAVDIGETDLQQIMQEVLIDLEDKIEESKADLQIDDMPKLPADAMQMHQLFQNLLGNALKFRHAEKPVKIKIIHEQRKGQHIFAVIDNGIGFDAKFINRIFKPFERLHSQSDYEGTGIGLAICKKIVDQHNGALTAKSKLGKGSTFIVILPSSQSSG